MSEDYGTKYENARDRALRVLSDGTWHGWAELEMVAGVRYGARLLELRRLGHVIEHADHPSGDGRMYRWTGTTDPQEKRVRVYLTEFDALELVNGRLTPSATAAVQEAIGSFRHNRDKL